MGKMKVLFVNDLHCGSQWGLCPPEITWTYQNEEYSHEYNSFQEILYGLWQDMNKTVGKVDVVVVNGDCVDGIDRKTSGKYQWTTNLNVQAKCAVQLLQEIPFRGSRRYFVTQGSNYHTQDNMSGDEAVAQALGARYGVSLLLDFNGAIFHICHFIGAAKSNLEAEIEWYLLSQNVNGHVDVIMRAHKHNFKYAGLRDVLAIQTGCWKGKEEFSLARGFKWEPQINYVWFEINEDGSFTWDYRTTMIEMDKRNRIVVK